MRHLLLSVTLLAVVPATGVSAAAAAAGPPTILVRSFTNTSGTSLVAWKPRPGAIGIAFRDDTADAVVVTSSTVTYWSEGRRTEWVRYRFEGMSRVLRIRFGISRAELETGLRSGAVVQIPSPLWPGGRASTFLAVDDFGTHVTALAKVSPFPFRYPGEAVLGLRLGDVSVIRLSGDFGFLLDFVYSSDPRLLGAGDREIVLQLATERSAAGSSYVSFLERGGPKIAAGGIVAVEIDPAQIVFRLGRVLGLAFAHTSVTEADWRTFLRALRPPPGARR